MDIILDTNIILQENFLRSKKFVVLIDYLKKTNSKIVLPQIVKEESISKYEETLSFQLAEATKKIEKISRICFSNVSIDFNIEVIKEVRNYIAYMQKLSKDELLYEMPYSDSFLHDVVFRMINRKKPCTPKGEESRDVILWLTIKNLLHLKKSVAFISNNSNEFASSDKTDLHPDLKAELAQENLELKYYLNLDDFIKNHAERVNYITKKWIENELSKFNLYELIEIKSLEHGESILIKRGECELFGYVKTIGLDLSDFYVYEMSNGDIYLHLMFSGSLEFEAVIDDDFKVLVKEFNVDFSAKIVNKEIKELEFEKWTWR